MIEPIAITIFGLEIYWYGIVYFIGFLFAYFMILNIIKYEKLNSENIENIFIIMMISSLILARLFHIIFYNPIFYLNNLTQIFAVWNGGMSIHGGGVGFLLSLYWSSKQYKIPFFKLTDIFLLPVAFTLALGRIANFINQELIGRITTSKIGIIFQNYDSETRHPYQIYASIKNIIVFEILLYLYYFKKLKPGILTAMFLILYNLGRFFLDFFREPTIEIGFISMGQIWCIIGTILGIILLYIAKNK